METLTNFLEFAPRKAEPTLAESLAILGKFPLLLRRIEQLEGEITLLKKQMGNSIGIPKGRKWVSLKEAAQILNLSEKSVRRYIERGFLRKSGASRHIKIPLEDIEKLEGKIVL